MVLVSRAEILRRVLRFTRRLRQLTYGRAKALQRLVIPCTRLPQNFLCTLHQNHKSYILIRQNRDSIIKSADLFYTKISLLAGGLACF